MTEARGTGVSITAEIVEVGLVLEVEDVDVVAVGHHRVRQMHKSAGRQLHLIRPRRSLVRKKGSYNNLKREERVKKSRRWD